MDKTKQKRNTNDSVQIKKDTPTQKNKITKKNKLTVHKNIKSKEAKQESEQINTDDFVTDTKAKIKKAYVIQIFASESKKEVSVKFPKLQTQEYLCSDGLYKYITGSYSSFISAYKDLSRIKALGYSDAFIRNIKYYKRNEVKIQNPKYTIQLLATLKKTNRSTYFHKLNNVKEIKDKYGMYRYYVGSFYSWYSAKKELNKIHKLGYDGFIQNLERFQK